MSALIYDFTSKTMLSWQLFYSPKMASQFENVTDFVTHDTNSQSNGILVKSEKLV